MLIMESVLKIRRMHQVDGLSVSAIARQLNLSRNTVRKYLRQTLSKPPAYRREQPAKPKLGEFEAILGDWLEADSKLPKRLRRSATRLHEDLQRQGYAGAYDSVQRFVKRWKALPALKGAYVPLAFNPAEAYQFDWSEEEVELDGSVQRLKVAHFRLVYSRMPFVIAFPRETQEMVFAAHDAAFAYWGGVTHRGIYDNLKTCVDAVLSGKERRFNARFLMLMSHYLIEPEACTPAAGWEKGQVEKQVQDVRRRCFTPRRKAKDLCALNQQLQAEVEQHARQHPHPQQPELTVWQTFEAECQQLRPLAAPFNGYVEREVRADSTCLVRFDRNAYSVDSRYANRHVTLRVFADRLVVMAEGQQIADHPRLFGRNKTQYNPWHYLALLERKPGALRNGAPFQTWALPESVVRVQRLLLNRKGGDRDMVSLLLAAQQDGLDALEAACRKALENPSVTAALVLNQLQRLRQPEVATRAIDTQVIPLSVVPVANCARYDQLRKGGRHADH
ncbi:transposase [Marinobacterium zhoushanense]|uniref:Transposase n=2 Tax=Marinobacterium zhoushanense TaxID=1679163 RepID=A0ABQ1K420_9GAMM|nr:IS21 family transposase [Marinobacterium zhoushanense]GGB87547.1 transposase [Marinobacterium zhoushanense]